MKNSGFALYDSPFGKLKIEYKGDYMSALKIAADNCDREEKTALTEKACAQLDEYFTGKRKTFDLPYKLTGTDFQLKVWGALINIPYGETRSYKEIAAAIGSPNASRAIGGANNKNPIAIVIPCHRVIGSNGKLIGYAGGIDMKTALLELERKSSE